MKRSLLILLVLVSLIPIASAGSSNYEISSVYVDGLNIEKGQIQVELDSTLQIAVFLEGSGETTDVRVKAWVNGYEYGEIVAYSEVFDIEDGVQYKKYLYLDIPEDLDASGDEYTLYVAVFDSQNSEEVSASLYIEQERHNVVVEEILLSSNTVVPGDYLGVKVRLENQGETDEDDLRVTVSIPVLGVSQTSYLDELVSGDQDETSTVYLTIPSYAETDNYEVLVEVSYDKGYSAVSASTYLSVDGEAVSYDENAIVSISSISDLTVGEASTYTVQVTNLASTSKTYTLSVEGLDAGYTESITVSAGKTGALYFTLIPEETGVQSVMVTLSSDDGVVVQEVYSVDVGEGSNAVVFVIAILLALLVVFGIATYLRTL